MGAAVLLKPYSWYVHACVCFYNNIIIGSVDSISRDGPVCNIIPIIGLFGTLV